MMNLSIRFRALNELTLEENQIKFDEENKKRIQYYLKKLQENEELISEGKDAKLSDIGIESFKKNIEYVNSLRLLDKDELLSEFRAVVADYTKFLTEELEDETISPLRRNYITSDLAYVGNIYLTEKYTKERFGKMLMLIIKNLAVKPSFSGYTDNWKDEFFGNAIEKVLLYCHNFDENLLSKRTGKKSKAFAYITQICFNAFIAVINERKKEQKLLKNMVPYETIDGFTPYNNTEIETEEDETMIDTHVFEVFYFEGLAKNADDEVYDDSLDGGIVDFFQFQLSYVERENAVYETNDLMKKEIEILEKTTPKEQRNKDYISYIRELEDKIQPCEFIKQMRTIRLVYAENVDVTSDQMNSIMKLTPSYMNVEIVKKRSKREKVMYKDPDAELVFGDFELEFQEEEW